MVVVRDGQIIHAKGYGMAELGTDQMAGADTSYRLASVTKQFIGMSIAMLVERGQLTYETTLKQAIPTFPTYGQRITINHLLHHTSGLRDYESLIPGGQTEQLSDQDVLDLYRNTSSTAFTPGSQYSYCNGGYVLLGLVVEAVSGKRLSDFLKENVFQPLGMQSEMLKGKTRRSNTAPLDIARAGSGWRTNPTKASPAQPVATAASTPRSVTSTYGTKASTEPSSLAKTRAS